MGDESRTWEYRAAPATDPTPDLDGLGREGWELVAALTVGGAPTLYFKRPAPSLRQRVTLDQRREVYARAGLALPDVDGPQA